MLSRIVGFYRRPPPAPPIADGEQVARSYRRWRWSVFLSVTLGYGFYYTCRLPLAVTKTELAASGLLTVDQLGMVGSALLVAYALGKGVNGFLADHLHVGRFMISGLVVSALLNVGFGCSSALAVFVLLWAFNGWAQSAGAPCSGVTIASWFTDRERGTRYSIWSLSHNIGEGITLAGTSLLVTSVGWRWGFVAPGVVCLAVATALRWTLADRPRSLGLPPIEDRAPATVPASGDEAVRVGQLQRHVLRDWRVWVLGCSSALMYVARYATTNWGRFYLIHAKGYAKAEAGVVTALFPIVGAAGTAVAGWASDRFFAARRTPPSVICGVLLIVSQAALYFGPAEQPWVDRAAMCGAGFAVSGLLVYVGGLTAMDICPKQAVGAALGIVGWFSYIGASAQDWVSGYLIGLGSVRDATGAAVYDFAAASYFWIGASVLSLLLAASLWRAETSAKPSR